MRSDLCERLLLSLTVDCAALINEVMAEDDAHNLYLESYPCAAKDCAQIVATSYWPTFLSKT